ncbi:MAG: alkyl hydroperoxide reductase subunit F [Flavobacteriaceae bacterium]
MLAQGLKDQVKAVFANLNNEYTLKASVSEDHPKREELVGLLTDVAGCSDKVSFVEEKGEALSFEVLQNEESSSNIQFKMVPNGHEFTTLLLAVLNKDGIGKNLPDQATIKRIQALDGSVLIKSFISLTCTNCPDVVQALNLMAIYNPNISHELIDGGLYQEEIDALNVQAVPTVYADKEVLHIGRSTLGELLDKLETQMGSTFQVENQEPVNYDVVVVGGGPAGVSSAIYSARKGFSVALVADAVGGQVLETMGIENLISTPKTTGKELSADMRSHLEDYNIDILENRRVQRTEVVDGFKHVYASTGEVFVTPALIIATGASWRKLNVPGEQKYIGSGVAFCTHCDGPFYKDKKVVVVGGGNSGLEAAIDLSSIATEVTVLEFMDTVKGDQVLQNKIDALANVKIITMAQTMEVVGDDTKVTGIVYKNRETEELVELTTDGVFVQIGLQPNSSVFKDLVSTNRFGEIEVDPNCRTNVAGVYAAGDVTVVPYKQIVVAMGEGSKAALSAFDDQIKDLQLA